MKKITIVSFLFVFFIAFLIACGGIQEKEQDKISDGESATYQESTVNSEEANNYENNDTGSTKENETKEKEEDEYAIIDKFIELYNLSAKNKIEDVKDMDIHGEDYKTEFRLHAFDDAVGKKCSISEATVYIVNYGNFSNDSIRIYISGATEEEILDAYVTTAHILDPEITDDEILKEMNSTSIVLGHIGGYVNKSEMMLDCTEINF